MVTYYSECEHKLRQQEQKLKSKLAKHMGDKQVDETMRLIDDYYRARKELSDYDDVLSQ
jgi:pantothenate kinase-related protein Tda10